MDIAVSIVCNAYNHENYIRDALESFVMQKTNFKFEVLVHDDASTDKTADIIREYEKKYPDLIKPIYQTENQYSKGFGLVGKLQLGRAVGKYIAYCEGDDYWTDPVKLQKQYDAMEAHPEVDICAHCGMRVNAETKECIGYIKPSDKDCILTMEQVILGGGGYVVTNSLMYRRELIYNEPEFRKFLKLDYTLQMYGALRGGMLYLSDCMSAYRIMAKGSWTSRTYSNPERFKKHTEKLEEMFALFDKDTNYQYSDVVKKQIEYQWFDYLYSIGDYKKAKSKNYREFYCKLPLTDRIRVNIRLYLPWLSYLKKKLTKKKCNN